MKFLGEVVGFLAKLALFFLVVGLILGFVIGLHANAAESLPIRCLVGGSIDTWHRQ
jgi:hypothetical protein